MTPTLNIRARCGHRRQADRHWRRRWDMAWTPPSFGWLVAQGMVVSTLAGAIAGACVAALLINPFLAFFGAPVGGAAGFSGSLVVAPLVACVLRGAHARSIRIALLRARLAAVTATFVMFQVLVPMAAQGRPAGLHEAYAIGVGVACIAAWWATRTVVIAAVRSTLRSSQP